MGSPERLDPALMSMLAVAQRPPLHRDPFDRLLVAQAQTDGLLLTTADERLSRYPGPIRKI